MFPALVTRGRFRGRPGGEAQWRPSRGGEDREASTPGAPCVLCSVRCLVLLTQFRAGQRSIDIISGRGIVQLPEDIHPHGGEGIGIELEQVLLNAMDRSPATFRLRDRDLIFVRVVRLFVRF